MAFYDHICNSCFYEWEQEYSIKIDPPKQCPNCQKETVQRLISMTGKGVVELTGNDLVDKCKADAKQLQRDASKSEKIFSNLLGESKYQALQQKMDKNKR
jgi:putative FmdB family regulatory protein